MPHRGAARVPRSTIRSGIRRVAGLKRELGKLRFDRSIHPQTRRNHDEVLRSAEQAVAQASLHEAPEMYADSSDPLVQQGYRLKLAVERRFKDTYSRSSGGRIMIHVPDAMLSPAGYSLFTNLAESLRFLGVPTYELGWRERTGEALDSFNPTVLLSSDNASYVERIEWGAVARHREWADLRVGLTASLAEYGNTPLAGRLAEAEARGVDFFYSFRDETYVSQREEYALFFESGYQLLHVPFGANSLHYYPVAGFHRDIDYVLIATRKDEHTSAMRDLVRSHAGFIDGPGWRHTTGFRFNRDRDRYVYARARAGVNVHLAEQLAWASEVNERTYQLAACGVPQIVDPALLLSRIFSPSALFIASTPEQYADALDQIISDPEAAQARALVAQAEVFTHHTTLHRADAFMGQLTNVDARGPRDCST